MKNNHNIVNTRHQEILNFINNNKESFAIIVILIDKDGVVKMASSTSREDLRHNLPTILRELADKIEVELQSSNN